MKKLLILTFFSLLTCFPALAQDFGSDDEVSSFGSEEEMSDFFGFMLLPGTNLLERFYEIHINHDGSIKYTQLTMDGFVNRAKGLERSVANPEKKDFFAEFNIKNPGVVADLWRLRYKEDPYDPMFSELKLGWANNPECDWLPSAEQFDMLKQFGIETIHSLCYGDKAFMLLYYMSQADWIAKYKGAGSANPVQQGATNEQGESFVD